MKVKLTDVSEVCKQIPGTEMMWDPCNDWLWHEYKGRCPFCPFDAFASQDIHETGLTYYHLVPQSKRVANVDDVLNIVMSCVGCNAVAMVMQQGIGAFRHRTFDVSAFGTEAIARDLVEKRLYVTYHKQLLAEAKELREPAYQRALRIFRGKTN